MQAEGEAGSMQEPDVGLDPRTPGSCPELKAQEGGKSEEEDRGSNDHKWGEPRESGLLPIPEVTKT